MANYQQGRPPLPGVKVDMSAAASSISMRSEQITNDDLKELGTFKYFVYETSTAKDHLRGHLRPDRKGEKYKFVAGESNNIFDKLEDFFGALLPYLDHHKRIVVMTLSRKIFKHCQPALCFLKSETVGDGSVQVVMSRLQLSTSKLESSQLDAKLKALEIRTDQQQCVIHNPNANPISTSLSMIQCHTRNSTSPSYKAPEVSLAHNLKQHGYMVMLMLKMIEIQDTIVQKHKDLLIQKRDLIHKLIEKRKTILTEAHSNKEDEAVSAVAEQVSHMLRYESSGVGIKVIEFVNLPSLTPELLKLSGLREFPALEEVCVFNCAQFAQDVMYHASREINRSIREAHGRYIDLDWSTGRTVMGNSMKQYPTYLAWLCFLYRGAKKVFDVATMTSSVPAVWLSWNLQNLGYSMVEKLERAADFPCMTLWLYFVADSEPRTHDAVPKLGVLQRRLVELITKHARYPPPDNALRDTMKLGKLVNDLLHQGGFELKPDTASMSAIEELAYQMYTGRSRLPNNAQRILMKCDVCRHLELPEIFFSSNSAKQFRRQEDVKIACWGCRYEEEQRRLVEEHYAPAAVADVISEAIGDASINSIREYAHLLSQRQSKKKESGTTLSKPGTQSENALVAFVRHLARTLSNPFEYRDVQLSDPDFMKLLPELARMCPHKLFMKACPLKDTCKMGIPLTFQYFHVNPNAKPLDSSRVHEFIPAVCRCYMLNDPPSKISLEHEIAHGIQAKEKYKELYAAVLTTGRLEAHKEGKLNMPFIMPDLRIKELLLDLVDETIGSDA